MHTVFMERGRVPGCVPPTKTCSLARANKCAVRASPRTQDTVQTHTHTHTPQLTPGDFLTLTQGKPLPVKQEQAATSVSTGWPLQHEGGQCRTPFVDVVCQVMFGVNR